MMITKNNINNKQNNSNFSFMPAYDDEWFSIFFYYNYKNYISKI